MPKIRLDQLPLDLRKQATSGEGIVNKREIEPSVQGALQLRTGSERQDEFDKALGVVAEGDGTYLKWTKPFIPTAGSEFTMGFTVSIGDLAEDGSYPLLVVHKDTTDNDVLVRVDLKRASGSLTLVLTAKGASTSAVTCNIAATKDTDINVAIRRDDNLYTITDGSNTATVNDGSGTYTGPYNVDILGTNLASVTAKPRVGGKHPVLNNLFLSTNVSATIGTVLGDRVTNPSAAGTVGHWNLDGSRDIDFVNADAGTGGIVGTPAIPARLTSGLYFTGLRTAARIEHTSVLDGYWQTPTTEPTTDTFGIHIEGSRGIEPVARETILLDWGDLAVIKIDTSNRLSFTHNGETIVGGTQFTPSNTATYSFSAFCGKQANGKIYLRCLVASDEDTAVSSNAVESAYLEYDNIKDILIGASNTASEDKTFKGTLSKLALYDNYYDRDGGRENAEFYFDLTDTHIYDLSVNNHVIDLITNSNTESLSPTYAKGGLTDGDFVSVEGGVAQSASGPKNYTTKIKRQLGTDLTSSRLGHHTFLTSNNYIHVSNSRTERVRTLGLPMPGREVGITSIGAGTLQGAYSYAFRYVSRDGTVGPIRKQPPVFTDSPTRFLLGKTDGRNTPLGASYLELQPTAAGYHWSGDCLKAKLASAPTVGHTHTFETYAKTSKLLKAWTEEQGTPLGFEEDVYMRGSTDAGSLKAFRPSPSDPEEVNGNGTHWRTENSSAHLHDLTDNWTIQTSFRLQRSQVKLAAGLVETNDSSGGSRDGLANIPNSFYTGLFSIDGNPTPSELARTKNVAFSAHLHHVADSADTGDWSSPADQYFTGQDSYLKDDRYGSKSYPRLVIQRSNNQDFEGTNAETLPNASGMYNPGVWEEQVFQDYYPLTFSNDRVKSDGSTPFWVDGELYTIVCIKRGESLTVKVHNGTDDEWYTLTSYTMVNDNGGGDISLNTAQTDKLEEWRSLHDPALGSSTNGYTSAKFFKGWDPVTTYGFSFGSAGRNLAPVCGMANNVATSGTHYSRIARTPSIFGLSNLDFKIPGMGEGAEYYQFRFWNEDKSDEQITTFALRRFAAKELGDPLHPGIAVDFCPLLPLHKNTENRLTDVISEMPWEAGETAHLALPMATGAGIGRDNFPTMGTDYRISRETRKANMVTNRGSNVHIAGRPREIPILSLNEEYTNMFGGGVALFFSEVGNGSLILRAGGVPKTGSTNIGTDEEDEGSYMIPIRTWNEHITSPNYATGLTTLRAQGFNIADWNDFNWFTFDVTYGTATASSHSDKRTATVNALAVNGQVIFNSPIGGRDQTAIIGRFTSDDWILVGNTNNLTNVSSHTYGRRFSEDLHVGEFRMWKNGKGPQDLNSNPRDFEYVSGRVASSDHTNMHHYYKFQPDDASTLKNYGTETAGTVVSSTLVDTQTGLAFENVQEADIAAIDVFRTIGAPVTDFTDYTENERQDALLIAKNSPHFYAGRVPVTTGGYVDTIPDGLLGEQLDETEGFVPNNIVSSFVWDDRLILIDDENRLWPSQPGSLGWESYPKAIRIPNALGPAVAGFNIQGERNQAMVLVAGKSWATLLTGSPDDPKAHLLGSGVGAESQRCITAFSGIGFIYNGTLWAIQQGQAVDFGAPVQELLPTPANTRLATSAKLSSLFVIDITTGTCLRYHFPTQQWTVEERWATSVGDLDSGEDAWTMLQGAWAKGSTSVYGDDVQDDTPASNTGTLNTTTKVFTTTGDQSSKIHTNMRVAIVQSETKKVDTYITAVSGTSVTVNSVATIDSGSSTSCTMYFGTGTTGAMLDTGPMDTADNTSVSPNILVDSETGSGWEFAAYATKYPGVRTTRPTGLSYTAMSSSSGLRGTGVRGRFQRVVLRNLKREQGLLPIIEIEVK